jgi:c-di-GMP-binding flagellar brake protein YcgR
MERRSSPRREAPFTVMQILETRQSHETFFAASGRNLSLGGMLIETDSLIELHIRIFTMLRLGEEADAPLLSTEGIVVHVAPLPDGCLCGIRFYDLTPDNAGKLAAYLEGFPELPDDQS